MLQAHLGETLDPGPSIGLPPLPHMHRGNLLIAFNYWRQYVCVSIRCCMHTCAPVCACLAALCNPLWATAALSHSRA